MAQSLEAFEQMTAESPPRERTPPGYSHLSPHSAITDRAKVEQHYGGN
jgi:hypothetical protein